MKRLLCGSVVLAASLGFVSCNGDPTSDFRDAPDRILASPSELFVEQGSSKPVTVTLVDAAGDPFPGDFAVTTPGSEITVAKNEDFLPTTIGVPLESQAQFIVTGNTAASTSFTLTAAGVSLDVPVRVTPTSLDAAVFSNAAPAANEPVTLTAEGYSFLPEAAISFAGDSAVILSNDGTALVFLPSPGATGTALVEGIAINFLPETSLALQTTAELTVGAVTPQAGTDAPATAPEITVAGPGETTAFFDGGTFDYPAPIFGGQFGNFPARLYKFTVPADGDFTVLLNWAGTQDFGVYYFLADGTTETGTAADGATADVKPETSTSTFTAGTYLMAVINFDSPTDPAWISIQFTTEPPAE